MKKIKLFLLSTILCLGSASSLTSCNSYTKECTHETTHNVYDQATCTTPKIKHTICNNCSKELSREEIGDALGHDYEETTVEPTKYEGGYVDHTCKRCKDNYVTERTISLMEEAKSNGLPKVLNYLKQTLKDPDSMLYEATCYSTIYDISTNRIIPGYFAYDINYNAKNGFGAYVGYKHKYYLWDTRYRGVSTANYEYYSKHKLEFYFTVSNK